MKKFILFIGFATLGLSSLAQSKIDERLYEKFTKEEVAQMSKDELKFNTYCIEHAYFIGDFPKEKAGNKELQKSIQLNNLDKINFYDLGIELIEDQYQYFKIEGTEKLLTILPLSILKQQSK